MPAHVESHTYGRVVCEAYASDPATRPAWMKAIDAQYPQTPTENCRALMISAWGHDDDVVDLTPDRDGQTVVDADGGGMAHGAPLV